MPIETEPFFLTLKLSLITTTILLFIGLPFAYWLSCTSFRFKYLLEAMVNLPLILPPTVIGFYFLIMLNPSGFFGNILESIFKHPVIFTFEGLVIVSIVFSFPFMISPLYAGFQQLPASLKEASFNLGRSHVATFFLVILPNIRAALLSAIALSFAHTVGEFGVVFLVGGNIPGSTQVISVFIYSAVEAMDYKQAHIYSLTLVVSAYFLLLVLYFLNRRAMKIL